MTMIFLVFVVEGLNLCVVKFLVFYVVYLYSIVNLCVKLQLKYDDVLE